MKLASPVFLLFCAANLFVCRIQAQTSVSYAADSLFVACAEFDINAGKALSAQELFHSFLGLSPEHTFEVFDSSAIAGQLYNYSYLQRYKGIEVEASSMRLHYKDGRLFRFLGAYLPVYNFDTA
ncbi:MAG: hypothetical protein LBL18_02760, partial [Bacteroidales bacterium]|nr:hypothetical protein [Bacteroidales bacterium]